MLVENLQREDLSPIEQARAFGRLRDRAWSERQIAASTGVSPGQVHKRLALLRLPAALVTALGRGDLTVADALRLLDLPDDQLIPAWTQAGKESWRGVRGVVEAGLAALRAAEQAEQLRGAFTAAGVALIEDPEQTFGSDWWHHRLLGTFTVPGVAAPDPGTDTAAATGAAALPAGALAHVTTYGGNVRVQYFTHEPPARPDPSGPGGAPGASGGSTPPVDDEWRRRREADRRRAEDARAAADARAGACTRLVTGQLDPELAVDILADALLVDHTVEPYETAGLAAAWCGFDLAALAEDDDVDDPVTAWMDTQAAAGRLPARRAAVAVALAEAENTLGFGAMSDRLWTARERRHVRRLAAHAGYELTADDRRRLDTHEGASAGSTPHPEGTPR